jgi:hypothetical protein
MVDCQFRGNPSIVKLIPPIGTLRLQRNGSQKPRSHNRLQSATPWPRALRAAPASDRGGYSAPPSSAGPRKRIGYRLDLGGTFSLEEVSWRDV